MDYNEIVIDEGDFKLVKDLMHYWIIQKVINKFEEVGVRWFNLEDCKENFYSRIRRDKEFKSYMGWD